VTSKKTQKEAHGTKKDFMQTNVLRRSVQSTFTQWRSFGSLCRPSLYNTPPGVMACMPLDVTQVAQKAVQPVANNNSLNNPVD
jgi:hypothetical protein